MNHKRIWVRAVAALAIVAALLPTRNAWALGAPSAQMSAFAPAAAPSGTAESYPCFGTMEELRQYVLGQVARRVEKIYYSLTDALKTEYRNKQMNRTMGEMSGLPGVLFTIYDGGAYYCMNVLYYPGVRMADAYRSGDTSDLTDEELRVLKSAAALVDGFRQEYGFSIALERSIHDWMCENITYYTESYDARTIVPRFCTALGGMVDGACNCQGYSDTFYLLATLAGFDVWFQRGSTPGEDAAHVWNTIHLKDSWYIVDVCFDDVNGSDRLDCYYGYFNAPRTQVDAYEWKAVAEPNELAWHVSDYYYYACNEYGYNVMFEDMARLADYCYAMRQQKNVRTIHCMLVHAEPDVNAFHAALKKIADRYPNKCSWLVFAFDVGNDVCYSVVWTSF